MEQATAALPVLEQAVATTTEQAVASATFATALATSTAGFGMATIAATTATGNRLALTAQQGDADHREENRDAEHYSSIHSKFLQNSW
jgi:hypothetical protein